MDQTITKKRQSHLSKKEKEISQKAIHDPMASMRSLLKNNLYYFIQYFWSEYAPDRPFSPNWHIEKLCRELEQVARRVASQQPNEYDLIINVPPGTTKTATVSIFYPVWCWVNWHWMRFITASHGHDLSLESAEYSRDVIRSEKFQAMFPEIDIKEDKDRKSNFRVIKKQWVTPGRAPRIVHGGNRLSTSVGGGPTGFHGDILIWDDLIDPKGSVSEAERKAAINFVDQTLSQRKTDRRYSSTIGIMQRLHQNDPTAHLLENRDNIKHICLPGEIKTPEYKKQLKPQEWGKYYKDGLLDLNRLNWDVLKQAEKELGTFGYAGQVGQNPIPPGGRMFKIDHFQVMDYIQNPDANVIRVVRYWDKAGSEGTGAYTVGVKMAELQHDRFVVMDVKRGQWSSEERERIIKETAQADGKDVMVGVEQEPGSGGKESAEGTIKNLKGFSAYAERPTGDKVNRADQFSVQVNWGNVYLLRADWNSQYTNELEYFPDSTYKDQVDASSGAFKFLTEDDRAGVW